MVEPLLLRRHRLLRLDLHEAGVGSRLLEPGLDLAVDKFEMLNAKP